MSRFKDLTDEEREQIYNILEREYALLKRNRWYHLLGGAVAMLVAIFAVSYAGTRAGLYANRAEAAIERIEKREADAVAAMARIQELADGGFERRLSDCEGDVKVLGRGLHDTAYNIWEWKRGHRESSQAENVYFNYVQQAWQDTLKWNDTKKYGGSNGRVRMAGTLRVDQQGRMPHIPGA
jgi:hypothetical protein